MHWDRKAARKGDLDGQFLMGSLSAGTYSLPSCTVPMRRKDDLVTFASEAQAKAAGLKACKVCKPDRYYATHGNGLSEYHQLAALLARRPASVVNGAALAEVIGATPERLEVLVGDHAHLTAAEWLDRERSRFAARALIGAGTSVSAAGTAAGFADEAVYKSVFSAHMAMSPQDYRKLGSKQGFTLQLPADYQTAYVLAYQGRDPEGIAERSDDSRVWKALSTPDGPVVMEIHLQRGAARITVEGKRPVGPESMAKLHRDALKILGLGTDISRFEAAHPDLVGMRRGLRVTLIPSAFDALAWAIMGQQINVSFAGSLRRDLILLAGERVGDMYVHPTPERVAGLDAADLTSRRFSRSKTKYLLDVAQSIAAGELDIEGLVDGSAVDAEAALTAQHGVGVWTARYVLMRTGFGDAAPVGDSGLATALHRLHQMPERPDATGTARLMARYSPWRSLASMHLWASLSA